MSTGPAMERAADGLKSRSLKMPGFWFWFNYGDTLFQLGDHAEAENMLAQALKLNPNHQPTIEKLSMVREKLKEHE
jgi:tetratricopeptide (TPR) repeat protein